ncbi:hypothetical protein ZIOFF_069991 [Zingiber officinale]|uniref:adenylate kinase n=1 Tax=Zingiber officinale TaxID=94328 RepID=A0A8J5C4W8_ZINOF|nr:hypothetical protein ZIOFF_069991 [Zingiber officinale]
MQVGVEPDLVLFFDCPEEEIVERILKRNQGRIDDNIDTIKKRLESFKKLSLPVIDHYTAKGKVYKVISKIAFHPLFPMSFIIFVKIQLFNLVSYFYIFLFIM